MIVLGIDPGLANLGWCVMAGGLPVATGVLRTAPIQKKRREALGISKVEDKMRRADDLAHELHRLCEDFRVTRIAHEAISLGFHQSTTLFDLGLAFGVVATTAAAHGLERRAVTPAEVKRWVRSRYIGEQPKRVEKENVIHVVRETFPNIVWPKAVMIHEHLADAVVCALLRKEPSHGA